MRRTYRIEKSLDIEEFIRITNESLTMKQAAVKLGLHFNSFRRIAVKYGVYRPNRGGKGTHKHKENGTTPLTEILEGNHPSYQTFRLKLRLISEGIFIPECSECKNTQWNKKEIPLELDHIDGNSSNHLLDNLRLLCPNCHAQTETYRGKNKKF